jgi:urease accessory protein
MVPIMHRATTVICRADLDGRGTIDTITLPRADRHRRRIVLTSDGGTRFLLDLPQATYLAHGDVLTLDDGSLIEVRAAAEPLVEIHTSSAAALARIAWHIGNRHTPAEVTADAIYIQPDHVLEGMVISLGAHVHHVVRAFEPEGGAYGGKGSLQKGHHHGHRADEHDGHLPHDHTHPHDHAPAKPTIWRPG